MAKNTGRGFAVGRGADGTRGATFRDVKGNASSAVRVLKKSTYARATDAANTIIRSASTGRFIDDAAGRTHADVPAHSRLKKPT